VTLICAVLLDFGIGYFVGFSLFSYSLWFVLPIGAIGLAFFATSGFVLGAMQSRRKATSIDLAFLMLICFMLQVLVVAADYWALRVVGRLDGSSSNFLSYFVLSITESYYSTSSRYFGTTAPARVGDSGWLTFVPRIGCLLGVAKVVHMSFAVNQGYRRS
jgi:hypothetical protein